MIILSIFLKEFIDLLRDRRALVSGFAYVAFGPLVILMTVSVLATEARNDNWSSIRFCGPSSPLLEEELKSARLEFAPDAAICVLIPEDFETRLAEGRTARVQIRGDLLAQSTTIDRVETTVLRFASTLSTQRLLARGMAPTIANPVSVETQNNNSYSYGSSNPPLFNSSEGRFGTFEPLEEKRDTKLYAPLSDTKPQQPLIQAQGSLSYGSAPNFTSF